MPETKKDALARAKRLGFPATNVIKAEDGGYFIAPQGITKAKAKKAYADCRENKGKKETCAAVAWNIQKKKK